MVLNTQRTYLTKDQANLTMLNREAYIYKFQRLFLPEFAKQRLNVTCKGQI